MESEKGESAEIGISSRVDDVFDYDRRREFDSVGHGCCGGWDWVDWMVVVDGVMIGLGYYR